MCRQSVTSQAVLLGKGRRSPGFLSGFQGVTGLLLRNLNYSTIVWVNLYSNEYGYPIVVTKAKFLNSSPGGVGISVEPQSPAAKKLL